MIYTLIRFSDRVAQPGRCPRRDQNSDDGGIQTLAQAKAAKALPFNDGSF